MNDQHRVHSVQSFPLVIDNGKIASTRIFFRAFCPVIRAVLRRRTLRVPLTPLSAEKSTVLCRHRSRTNELGRPATARRSRLRTQPREPDSLETMLSGEHKAESAAVRGVVEGCVCRPARPGPIRVT